MLVQPCLQRGRRLPRRVLSPRCQIVSGAVSGKIVSIRKLLSMYREMAAQNGKLFTCKVNAILICLGTGNVSLEKYSFEYSNGKISLCYTTQRSFFDVRVSSA